MEKNEEGKVISKGLNTLLPAKLHKELTDYAMFRGDALGKWSYATAIRDLLDKADFYSIIEILLRRIEAIELKLNSEEPKKEEKKSKDVLVFGGKKIIGGDIDE